MSSYTFIIIGSALGFFALAAALLIPVYRFLKREEQLAEELDQVLAEELRRRRAKRLLGERGDHSDDDGGVLQPDD